MPLTVTGSLPAEKLMEDDWLEVGGCMLRIRSIARHGELMNINMYAPTSSHVHCTLMVSKDQPMKIYNQRG